MQVHEYIGCINIYLATSYSLDRRYIHHLPAKLQPSVRFKVLIFQFGSVRIPKAASLSQGLVGIVAYF